MIVDAHVHASRAAGHASVTQIRDQCARNGVSLVVLSSLGQWRQYPGKKEVHDANAEARACAEQSGGLIRWLAYLNPQNDNWRQELDRCVAGGAIGIKLWISLRDKKGRLDNTTEVIGAAAARRFPVLVHTFYRTDPPHPGEATLEEVAALARRFPDAPLIAAHAGGSWRNSLSILRQFPPSAFVDISGCFPEKGIVEALVRTLGADRILFGSDMLGRSVASQLAKVQFANISAAAREAILSGNAARVFGLTDLPPGSAAKRRARLRRPASRTDHFCFCGRWPFFKTPATTPRTLDRRLAAAGVAQAYAGDLGSVYRLDLENANDEFARACRSAPRLAPLATLNPRAPNWRQTVGSMHHASAGVMLHPYLHNWRLDDGAHADCLAALAANRLPLWINCALGDRRFRHSGLACRPVTTDELIGFALAHPSSEAVVQGATPAQITAFLRRIPRRGRFRFEVSRLTDAAGALATALREFGTKPFVMGSEFPLRDLREVRWVAAREWPTG